MNMQKQKEWIRIAVFIYVLKFIWNFGDLIAIIIGWLKVSVIILKIKKRFFFNEIDMTLQLLAALLLNWFNIIILGRNKTTNGRTQTKNNSLFLNEFSRLYYLPKTRKVIEQFLLFVLEISFFPISFDFVSQKLFFYQKKLNSSSIIVVLSKVPSNNWKLWWNLLRSS